MKGEIDTGINYKASEQYKNPCNAYCGSAALAVLPHAAFAGFSLCNFNISILSAPQACNCVLTSNYNHEQHAAHAEREADKNGL